MRPEYNSVDTLHIDWSSQMAYIVDTNTGEQLNVYMFKILELVTCKVETVLSNYHISVKHIYYSVLFEYIKQNIAVRNAKVTA